MSNKVIGSLYIVGIVAIVISLALSLMMTSRALATEKKLNALMEQVVLYSQAEHAIVIDKNKPKD